MTPEQFRQYLYAGGANDQQATERILQYGAQNQLTAQQLVDLTNAALGTNFTPADLARATDTSVAYGDGSSARADNITTTFDASGSRIEDDIDLIDGLISPTEFRNMIYAGGANDQVATERLLRYGAEQGLTADQLTALTNAALGTDFDAADLAAAVDRSTIYGDGSAARDTNITTTFDAQGNRVTAGAGGAGTTGGTGGTGNIGNTSVNTNTSTASTLMSPEAFRRMIYAGGANDQQATERIFQYMLSNNLSFNDVLGLTNRALGTSFGMDDLTRAMRGSTLLGSGSSATAPDITTTFNPQGERIPFDSPEYRAPRQFDIGTTPTAAFSGADQVGGLAPTFLFNPDAQYQSGLIKSLRERSPMGFSNPGFTMLQNAGNSSPVDSAPRQPRNNLNTFPTQPPVYVPPTVPPPGPTPQPPGGGGGGEGGGGGGGSGGGGINLDNFVWDGLDIQVPMPGGTPDMNWSDFNSGALVADTALIDMLASPGVSGGGFGKGPSYFDVQL